MSLDKVKEYDGLLKEKKIPLEFMSYGVGSGFYNDLDRDYLGFAMKTAVSNGKDRMKLTKSNPFKMSIPGFINLIKEDGKLVVEYTRNGLLQTVYDMDERSSRPKLGKVDWKNIQRRALKEDMTQQEIILSPLVLQNINTFKEKYLHENVPKPRM